MNKADFLAYKNQYLSAISKVLKESTPHSLDEAAFPAYSHPNPWINDLFWMRLRIVMETVDRRGPYQTVLDYGCGSGVLLPFLANRSAKAYGVDINLEPFQKMQQVAVFPENITVLNLNACDLRDFPQASFDLVTALDVFEHVENLDETLDQLLALLKPNGKIVVSLPTENILYKIGRQLAGKEFTGDYHIRKISEIEQVCRQKGKVEKIANLPPVFTLFKIFSIEKL